METLKKEIILENEILKLIPKDYCFFDIETLGLNPATAPVYLIGVLDILNGTPAITLFFANNSMDEEAVLLAFKDYLSNFKGLITFNGEAFDIPYVIKRFERYEISHGLKSMDSIDIYKKVRPLKAHLGLSRLNQKTLEEFLYIYRDDKYDGGRLINVYKEYEYTGDNELKDLLILHNFEDVKGMPSLLYYFNYYNLIDGNFDISVIDVSNQKNILFSANLPGILKVGIRKLEENYHIKAVDYMIMGSIDLEYTTLKLFHKNTKDYVYLPDEDIIIPKSLSRTIPKERIQKATKENCFTKKQGYFFKLPADKKFKSYYNFLNLPIFKKEYTDKDVYILIDINKDSPEKSELPELIKSLIKFSFS